MRKIAITLFIAFCFAITIISCGNGEASNKKQSNPPKLKSEIVKYTVDSLTMESYVVYDENIVGSRPAILIIPEWWGLNEYAKRRANELAELGYYAMAVDMYGFGRQANNPQEAGAMAGPFYKNPMMTKAHFGGALKYIKTNAQVDTSKIGAMGYCFGGAVVLNVARLGEDLKGVVSFHGSLLGTPFNKNLLKAKVLVLHGQADQFVPATEVATFKQQMDSIGASYNLISYPGATHAFTNPDATATGKKFNIPIAYNATADSASFDEMKKFFSEVLK